MIWTIRGRRAFQTLARTGRTVRTETLWCTFLDDPAAVPLRVGFAIGRSIGSAVHRNRLRRRMRAAVRTVAAELELQRGWLLIGAKPAANERTFASLTDELTALVARATATSRR